MDSDRRGQVVVEEEMQFDLQWQTWGNLLPKKEEKESQRAALSNDDPFLYIDSHIHVAVS